MTETTITYQPIIRKKYFSPWIHVKNVELRGGMIMGSPGAGGGDPEPEEGNDTGNGWAKSSTMFFDNPFETENEIEF